MLYLHSIGSIPSTTKHHHLCPMATSNHHDQACHSIDMERTHECALHSRLHSHSFYIPIGIEDEMHSYSKEYLCLYYSTHPTTIDQPSITLSPSELAAAPSPAPTPHIRFSLCCSHTIYPPFHHIQMLRDCTISLLIVCMHLHEARAGLSTMIASTTKLLLISLPNANLHSPPSTLGRTGRLRRIHSIAAATPIQMLAIPSTLSSPPIPPSSLCVLLATELPYDHTVSAPIAMLIYSILCY